MDAHTNETAIIRLTFIEHNYGKNAELLKDVAKVRHELLNNRKNKENKDKLND